tara:strand:+ start:151 stop:489 length:339 start_codon:yes stop_codon:yes gene_type:complete
MSKKKKKPYFPNNWQAFYECPAEYFESLPIEQFFEWRVEGWEIPSSVDCIIREEDVKTGTITEYVYSKQSAAKNRVSKIMEKGNKFTICTHDTCHHMFPKELEVDPYDDPLA